MQARLRKLALTAGATALLAVGSTGVVPQVADAAPGDSCVIVAQTARITTGGLYYPATDPNFSSYPLTGPYFEWTLNGVCANNGIGFESRGSAYGWCGRSVGQGTGEMGGRSYTVSWQSAGSQLVLTDPSAAGSVNAQPNPPGSPNGSCASGTATSFLVDGAITSLT